MEKAREFQKNIGAVFPACLVNLHVLFNLAGRKTHFSGEVDVPSGKEIVVNQPINGALADHDGVFVIDAYMVKGLPLPDERGKKVVKMGHFFFRKRNSLARLR